MRNASFRGYCVHIHGLNTKSADRMFNGRKGKNTRGLVGVREGALTLEESGVACEGQMGKKVEEMGTLCVDMPQEWKKSRVADVIVAWKVECLGLCET